VPALRLPTRAVVAAAERVGALAPRAFAARIRRPDLIVGCGRSGTTLLNHLFDDHPEVASFPSEANHLWHPRLYPWHTSAADVPPFFVDGAAFTRASLVRRGVADDLRLAATFGAYQAIRRRPVFLAKTVMASFMLDDVVRRFPEARLVHMVRDGRAVALSWVVKEADKLGHPRYREGGHAHGRDALLEIYARHWAEHLVALDEADRRLGLTASGRLFELSYEGLCAEPRRVLGGLADFLGISPAPFLAGDLSHIKDTNHKARAELGPEILRRMNVAARAGLDLKGYGDQIAGPGGGP
jgi:hypothetical protein